MKYKYNRFIFICEWLLLGVSYFFLFWLAAHDEESIKAVQKLGYGSAGLYIILLFIYGSEYINRYVELYNDHVRFNCFRFKGERKPVSLDVRYENIFSLEAVKYPIIGIVGVKVKCKNYPKDIKVSPLFHRHKEMYSNLIELVKSKNPKAYVDEAFGDVLNED